MTFQIFDKDLDAILDEVREVVADSKDSFGLRKDTSEIEERLHQLVEDLADYARDRNEVGLAVKLESLFPKDDDHGYRSHSNIEPSKLEIKILRVQRAFRTFGASALEEANLGKSEINPLPNPTKPDVALPTSNKVFLVHGHDDAVLHRVSSILQRLGLDPVVLREQPNRGQTIIEKFESNADVGFAVILMTADDMGASLDDADNDEYRPRARQNVILELGYFVGRLGRGRTSVLREEGVEQPSDIMGVVYTEIDKNNAWELRLAQEIKAAGYSIDLNRLY